jgi:uncharacterized cupin superfamily protein
MATIINTGKFEYKTDESALIPFKLQTLHPRLSKMVGSKQLVFDLRKLDPGKFSFPYHYHRNAEELVLIISGSITVRTSKGLEIVGQGQIVFFEIGEEGVHQFFNHTNEPCVYFDLRTNPGIDVAVYPDSGKINILPFNEIYEQQSRVEYNTGEDKIENIWENLK